jgi:hypothetical protein
MTTPREPTRAETLAPRVAQLVADGHGRNEIARRLYCSNGTVTRAAKIAGVTFGNVVPEETVERAAETRKTTTLERQDALAKGWSAIASRAITQLAKALDAGEIDPARLATIAGVATDKYLKLTPEIDQKAESMGEAKQYLTDLMSAIRESATDRRDQEDQEDQDDGPRLRDDGDFY